MEGLKAFIEFLASYPLWAKIVAASGIFVTAATFMFAPRSATETAHNAANTRIRARFCAPPGFITHSYSSLCVGLMAPDAWSSEDAAVRFGGGDADLIKRYEDTKGTVGLKLRLRNVQKNYINDITTEVSNQFDVWKHIDPNVTVADTTVSGMPAKVFQYKQKTGQRVGDVRVYWLRIVPQVKLDILAFIYDDAPDKTEFWKEIDAIVSSILIDDQGIKDRVKLL
ncbi:MAG: hypothetical protein ABL994_07495 [Verrucomicrobiales bacterium]